MADVAAIKTSDIPTHSERLARDHHRRSQLNGFDAIATRLRSKTWAELTADDKDAVLEAVALRLDLIKPG